MSPDAARTLRSNIVGMQRDIYERLKSHPTPEDDLCTCAAGTPIKLMSDGGISANPIHCLRCNREIVPERIPLTELEVAAIANWLRTYGAIDALELASGSYEEWARRQLVDPGSPPNVEGREVAAMLDQKERCYFWLWQPDSDDGFEPSASCPLCGEALTSYDAGIFPQLLCERDSLVLVGPERD